ncbi:TPA: hypothetical protein N0F65_003660 [Lagenidium giganteum]|uniref:Vesicle transport protein n=1 Tax=Lagenidium giganteum TaxID=4803 RepID=A0AAV2YHZ5_9STRA|nr:TPA: hypothetical protein N0F65_003660 [Lagenidium giganteum]
MSSQSAWEQWGAKKPTSGNAIASAQDAFQNLLRSSPLSSTASTASSDSDSGSGFSLKKVWDSAQQMTKNTVNGTVTPSNQEVDAMESGAADENADDENAGATWPLWRRQSTKETSAIPSMSWNSRFKYFVGLTLMGLMFFGMASIFLPLIMIRPSKFALSFTLGSICLMGAFAMLKGPAAYLKGLLEPKALLLTTSYFFTLGFTLYSCLILGNYVLVVCSSVMQLITLSAFAVSALPGGNAGIKTFGKLFMRAARKMIQAFAKLFS